LLTKDARTVNLFATFNSPSERKSDFARKMSRVKKKEMTKLNKIRCMNPAHRVFSEPFSDQDLPFAILQFKNKKPLREWLEYMGRRLRKYYWHI